MAQVGGIRIPFVVDMSDIPRSVREVDKELKRLQKKVGDVDLYIDGKHVKNLNREALIPAIRNFTELERIAKKTTVALEQIGRAMTALRAGTVIGDKLVSSLSQIPQVGKRTQEQIRTYNRLNRELQKVSKEAEDAASRIKGFDAAIAKLERREDVTPPIKEIVGEGDKAKARIVKGDKAIRQMMAVGIPKEVFAALKKYQLEYDKLIGTQEIGGKKHAEQLRRTNLYRKNALELIKQVRQAESEQVTSARLKQKVDLEKRVAEERDKAVKLLGRAEGFHSRELNNLQQKVVLEAKPIQYKSKEIQYWREQEKIFSKLMVKYRVGTLTDKERLKLQQVMLTLKQKEGWMNSVREKLLKRTTDIIDSQRRQEELKAQIKRKELEYSKALTKQERQQLDLQKKRRGIRGAFPGGGLFAPGRMTWFIQLRAFWEIYRVVGKMMTDLVELDEAVARSMRTMASDTQSYGDVATQVHETIIRTARDTGATYRDVGEALYQLSSAGLTAEESLAAVASVMRLTRTTEAEVTDATKVIAGVFNNFKESLAGVSTDTARFNLISSTLSYVWERNQIDMNEMVQALNQAAQASTLAGMSFTELAVVVGNLGTMMIRSGRAGRSIRTAIIQMAAKGHELASVFGFTFDPTAPLNFMETMDKMHEQWKDMTKSAIVAQRVFSIFGRRGAPAIIALLKNWEKVREEIKGASDPLELLTNQHEKLLRLQERYRAVSETLWKEFMTIIADSLDVVKWFGEVMHDVLSAARYRRSTKELTLTLGELVKKYEDAGVLTDRLAQLQAELRIAQEKHNEEIRNGIGIFRSWARVGAAALKWMSGGKIQEDVSIFAGTDPIAVIESHTKLIKTLKELEVLNRQAAIIAKRRRERELELATDIHTRREAEKALVDTIRLHRAQRGELIQTQEEFVEDLRVETDALRLLEERWIQVYRKHGDNSELLDSVNKSINQQSDAVKKLSKILLKFHNDHMKLLQNALKFEKELADTRTKMYDVYAKAVAKRTGLTMDTEIRDMEIRKKDAEDRKKTTKAQIWHTTRTLAILDKERDVRGNLRAEHKEQHDKLTKDLREQTKEYNKASIEVEGYEGALFQLYQTMSKSVRTRKPFDVVPLSTLKLLQRPEDLDKSYEVLEKKLEAQKEKFDLLLEYRNRFIDTYEAQEGREAAIERARLTRQIEQAELERNQLDAKIRATEEQRYAAAIARMRVENQLLDPNIARDLQAKENTLAVTIDTLKRQRKSIEANILLLKTSKRDLARKELELVDTFIVLNAKREKAQKQELVLLGLRQQFVDKTAVTDKYLVRESVRDLDKKIELLKKEQAQRQVNLAETKKARDELEKLAVRGELPAERRGQYIDLKHTIEDLENATRLANDELDYLTARRPGTEFLADLSYLDRLKDQQDKEQQHELRMFDIRTAYKEKYQTFFTLWTSKEELQERERLKAQRERIKIEIDYMKERRDKISQEMAHLQTMIGTTEDPQLRTQYRQKLEKLSVEYGDLGFGITEKEEEIRALQRTKTEATNQNIRNLIAEGRAVEAARQTWAFYGDTIQNYTRQMSDAWKDMFAEMGKTSKDAWDAYKAIAIAQAIVDTIKTAQAGAAALAGIPIIGPALAVAWIATSIAQGMFRVRQIETTKPQGYAQGGVTYGELKMLDRRRARSASYASGGVTSGPTLAMVGDNKSGREIVLPEEHIKDDYVGPAYRRQKGDDKINIINLVTDRSIAAAMMRAPGKNVIINTIGEDLERKKSTYRQVRGVGRNR